MDAVKAITDLIGAIAWPAVALTAIWLFQSQIGSLTQSLNLRVAEANKIKLKIGTVALELAREIARPPAVSRKVLGQVGSTIERFDALAKMYDEVSIEDETLRVAERKRLADELARLASTLSIRRADLAERPDEGAMVTLATLAIDNPSDDDLSLLQKVALTARFNFTRYRILLGILPSIARVPYDKNVRVRAETIIRSVEATGSVSPSLQRLIDKTRTVLSAIDEAFQ
ncbi:hypothetical protein [Rhizobium sp. Leaf453]|uniref:hypothetical protein n=1 Tax=Rhizobium sp. Leaf453 TaxID=1736380 RepID=UPI0007125D96|nr:hypothetical protein [Rhizobium sp. Leaf453]KQU08040.1 hypothetical protein ASG68_23575 [Rhizobium sp. Leaf453]